MTRIPLEFRYLEFFINLQIRVSLKVFVIIKLAIFQFEITP